VLIMTSRHVPSSELLFWMLMTSVVLAGLMTILTAAATKLLDEKNPNTDKNSPDGLVGVARRFVMFNGAVGKEQLSWLNDVLQDASALHLKVRKRHTLHFPFRALNRQLYMYMSGAPWHSLVTNRTTTPLQTWRS